ncbi:MAG TPA: hypothetical protein PLC88_09390, partial [Syntrophomonas sp.]|nr:hypothetical protein [Syntrophomonas sp.]
MRNTMIVVLAMIVLGICLLSGGCSRPDQSVISEWQELLKFPAGDQQAAKGGNNPDIAPLIETGTGMTGETITVSLYFADATRQQLVREDR